MNSRITISISLVLLAFSVNSCIEQNRHQKKKPTKQYEANASEFARQHTWVRFMALQQTPDDHFEKESLSEYIFCYKNGNPLAFVRNSDKCYLMTSNGIKRTEPNMLDEYLMKRRPKDERVMANLFRYIPYYVLPFDFSKFLFLETEQHNIKTRKIRNETYYEYTSLQRFDELHSFVNASTLQLDSVYYKHTFGTKSTENFIKLYDFSFENRQATIDSFLRTIEPKTFIVNR